MHTQFLTYTKTLFLSFTDATFDTQYNTLHHTYSPVAEHHFYFRKLKNAFRKLSQARGFPESYDNYDVTMVTYIRSIQALA